jgi:hypothetical protein
MERRNDDGKENEIKQSRVKHAVMWTSNSMIGNTAALHHGDYRLDTPRHTLNGYVLPPLHSTFVLNRFFTDYYILPFTYSLLLFFSFLLACYACFSLFSSFDRSEVYLHT